MVNKIVDDTKLDSDTSIVNKLNASSSSGSSIVVILALICATVVGVIVLKVMAFI